MGWTRFSKIKLTDKAIKQIKKWDLGKQIKKINKLSVGDFKSVNFKLRQPKSLGYYYFRINKQYRAICKIEGDILIIIEIDNHS